MGVATSASTAGERVVAVDLVCEQRSVLLTVTLVEDDQVRVNVMPKKLADSENNALTTPMSFTGTAAELDEQLPPQSAASSPATVS
ncbi:MAG TPA: PRTRC system protein E [Bryobacteraceae bacterium]|nr:PRTRC system protein E [Bryobacteraceae bacterium]